MVERTPRRFRRRLSPMPRLRHGELPPFCPPSSRWPHHAATSPERVRYRAYGHHMSPLSRRPLHCRQSFQMLGVVAEEISDRARDSGHWSGQRVADAASVARYVTDEKFHARLPPATSPPSTAVALCYAFVRCAPPFRAPPRLSRCYRYFILIAAEDASRPCSAPCHAFIQ